MATPDGKVSFEAGGKAYSLRFTTNALCALEDKTGKTTLDVATELQFNPRMGTIRAMYWAALDEADLTLAQVGEIIDSVGRTNAIKLVREAFSAAFPDAEEAKEGEKGPPNAAAG